MKATASVLLLCTMAVAANANGRALDGRHRRDDAGDGPHGRTATAFPLKSINANKVVFENRSHDYPQRISYWGGNAELCARIEGTINGKAASEQWCWSRLKP